MPMRRDDKQTLRQAIRNAKKEHTSEELQQMSLLIVHRVLDLAELCQAKTVVAYASLPDEVGTGELLKRLISDGKRVLLPKVLDDNYMELRQYTGRDDLEEGAFHIQEPIGPTFSSLKTIDVAIVPGMAFTPDGHRLGRGKGYYDRFLAQLHTTTVKIGVCFPFQLVEHLPSEPHDIRMDKVISLFTTNIQPQ